MYWSGQIGDARDTSFFAVLTSARLDPALSRLPFIDGAVILVGALARGEAEALLAEKLAPPTRALIEMWSFSEEWNLNGEGAKKTLNGYPDYAVISPKASREAWLSHCRREASIEAIWGDAWDDFVSSRRAQRDAVLQWLEQLPADAVVIAEVWDNS